MTISLYGEMRGDGRALRARDGSPEERSEREANTGAPIRGISCGLSDERGV